MMNGILEGDCKDRMADRLLRLCHTAAGENVKKTHL